MCVLVQPLDHSGVAANAEVGDRGRELFLSHALPPTIPYKIFNNYAILKDVHLKNQKKKEKRRPSYFSYCLINKYNI